MNEDIEEVKELIHKSIIEGVMDASIMVEKIKMTPKNSRNIYPNMKYIRGVQNPRDIEYGKLYMVTFISQGREKRLTNYTDYLLTLGGDLTPMLLLLGDHDYINTKSPMKYYCGGVSYADERLYGYVKNMKCIDRYVIGFSFSGM